MKHIRMSHIFKKASYKRCCLVVIAFVLAATSSLSAHAEIQVSENVHSNVFKQLNNIYFYEKDDNCLPTGGSSTSAATGGAIGGAGANPQNGIQVYQFLIGKGLSPVQALGIIGNLMQESGYQTLSLDPAGTCVAARTSGSMVCGIAQWLGSRLDNLLARSNPYTIETQEAFLWEELTTTYSSVYNHLITATDVHTATDIFVREYEVPCTDSTPGFSSAEACFQFESDKRTRLALSAAATLGIDLNDPTSTVTTLTPIGGTATSPLSGSSTVATPGAGCAVSGALGSGVAGAGFIATVQGYVLPEFHDGPYTGADKAMPDYVTAADAAQAAGRHVGNGASPYYADCAGFVTTLVNNTFDPSFNAYATGGGATPALSSWLADSSHGWSLVGNGNSLNISQLQPGDVAITKGGGHTWIYIGDVPGFSSKFAEAANTSRVPMAMISDSQMVAYNGRTTEWYRFNGSTGALSTAL